MSNEITAYGSITELLASLTPERLASLGGGELDRVLEQAKELCAEAGRQEITSGISVTHRAIVEAVEGEKQRRSFEQLVESQKAQQFFAVLNRLKSFAFTCGSGLEAIVNAGRDKVLGPLAKAPAPISEDAAANMSDTDLTEALASARSDVQKLSKDMCGRPTADALEVLADTTRKIAAWYASAATAKEKRLASLSPIVATLEQEHARRLEEKGRAEQEKNYLTENLPQVVRDLASRLEKLEGGNGDTPAA